MGAAIAAGCVALVLRGPVPQAPAYHDFADVRPGLGIPNAHNVLSNVPFLVAGVWGIARTLSRGRAGTLERAPWIVLFAGVTLTAFGSAYYHWAPSNDSLVWDRLPMAIGFMGLFAAVLEERVAPVVGRLLLWPFVMIGIGSVVYWHVTERAGHGDLRPYVMVQFVPLLALPVLLAAFPARFTRGKDFVFALIAYGSAKVFEGLDAGIFGATGHVVAGHAIKHVAAAVGCGLLAQMIALREPVIPPP
jgi:hypothetical protein